MEEYLDNIRHEIINTEAKVLVRNYKNNLDKLIRNYNIGKELFLAGKHYGEGIVKKYATILTKEFGKGYTYSDLNRMLKFYDLIEKVGPVAPSLTWSHYLKLLPLKDINEIKYYINVIKRDNLSKRELEERIKSDEYHRLPTSTRNKMIELVQANKGEEILNPIIIKNNRNKEEFTEKVLQELILSDLPRFMKQLGEGYTFVENEYKLPIGNINKYIDILLYNYIMNCFVVIELKVRNLKSIDLGQIKEYMNYIDINLKKPTQNKTLGILITKEINDYEIRYITSDNVYTTTFKIESE